MRSIRRSLLGYFLVLLALALGAVWLFVDQFARDALRAREEAETKRIAAMFEVRKTEAKAKFDAELVAETKRLDGLVRLAVARIPGMTRDPRGRPTDPRPKDTETPSPVRPPDPEVREYRLRAAAMLVGAGFAADGGLLVTAPVSVYRTSVPAWSSFEAPRTIDRIHPSDALRKVFDDDDRAVREDDDERRFPLPELWQFQFVVTYPGHRTQTIGSVRSPKLARDLPLDLAVFENPSTEHNHDDAEDGALRSVVVRGPRYQGWVAYSGSGLPSLPPFFGPPGSGPPGSGPPRPEPGGRSEPGPGPGPRPERVNRHWDYSIRVFIHYARPYTELNARLEKEQEEGREQLARVQDETRQALTGLRAKLGLIGGASFLALVVGGWVIVARGLSPVRRLSDAVSLVSEKDFHLPLDPAGLSRELVPIHARLTQTLDQLRRAFEREKEAVADISHELRTPIASLLATIDVSLRKPRSPDQYRATLEDCRAIARQLGQLVERIMTLASLDAGTARTATARVDAADMAAGCAAVIRPLAEAHGLTFHQAADTRAELDTDPDQLREVLMNLLHNAVEYNRPGGRVELNARRDNGSVVFEVRDTGIGMTPEVRDKIFERFFRADPSRHATGVHAGLGLAIVKEYVTRLGGTIDVTSRPDDGSTFRVSLPAASPAPPEEPDDVAPPPGPSRPEPRARGEAAPAGS